MRLALVAALAGALATGCLHDNLLACGDLVCPAGTTCVVALGTCAAADQVDACNGLPDLAPCTPTTSAPGTCLDGVCVRYCGDGVVEAGEDCDDGNQNPADGCDACKLTSWAATTVIGGNTNARATAFDSPTALAADRTGNIFIADQGNNVVWRLDASGVLTRIAGNFGYGFSGDGGPATSATMSSPQGLAVDGIGNVYIADYGNNRVRRVDGNGTITTIAGNDSASYSGDGGPAIAASLSDPSGLAVDGLGNLYIADNGNARVRMIDTTGMISTVAGNGTFGNTGDGGPATSAEVGEFKLALGPTGDLYMSDGYSQVRRVDAAGIIHAVAGDGVTSAHTGDGGPAIAAQLDFPDGIAVDALGNVYIAEREDNDVRVIDPQGMISTFAGTQVYGYSGDGGPAASAQVNAPNDIAVDSSGDVIIADTDNYVVRLVDPARTISTIAGNGFVTQVGDGGAATSATLDGTVTGLAVDAAGNLYVTDSYDERIRRIDATGMITTIAGDGVDGSAGDGGPATSAQMFYPQQIAFDAAGNLFIVDAYNNEVRRVDTSGIITRFAGTGVCGVADPSGAATSSPLCQATGVAIDAAGNVYITDQNRVTVVDPAGNMTLFAGSSTAQGSTGDGGPALAAKLALPDDLAVDGAGGLLIADTYNNRIRRVDAAGNIAAFAGNGATGISTFGDGSAATAAQLDQPTAAIADPAGNVYITDTGHYQVRRVDASGTISTIAGAIGYGFAGDGGPASAARFSAVRPMAFDPVGNLYVGDGFFVRRIDPAGVVTTVGGQVDPAGMGPIGQAQLADPRALVVGSKFSLVAGGASGTVQGIGVQPAWVGVVAGAYPQDVATGQLARFRDSTFGIVGGVALDEAAGIIYLSETTGNRVDAVTIVDPTNANTWTIAAVADAAGTPGFADGAAAGAQLRGPTGLYLDAAAHVLYVADTGNHAIRAIDLAGGAAAATVRTIAGVPATLGFFGDGGPATAALLFAPEAITACANGDLFVADTGNNRIRRIDGTGVITTVLGDGVAASSGQGSPAAAFPVDSPRGLACDPLGNLYATSRVAVRELPANGSGVVDGTGLVRTIYGAPPRDTFPASVTRCLTGIAALDNATLQVVDSCTGLLVQLARQ